MRGGNIKTCKFFLILCLVVFIAGSAGAQVVVDTAITGHVMFYYDKEASALGDTDWSYFTPEIRVGATYNSWQIPTSFGAPTWVIHNKKGNGVIEFNLNSATLDALTQDNFTAKLDGLNLTYRKNTNPMTVRLWDVGDNAEDGAVTFYDWHSTNGLITDLFIDTIPPVDTVYNNIDVTNALKHDIMGAGSPVYTGFVLKTFSSPPDNNVKFNSTTPKLKINILPPDALPRISAQVVFILLTAPHGARQTPAIPRTWQNGEAALSQNSLQESGHMTAAHGTG